MNILFNNPARVPLQLGKGDYYYYYYFIIFYYFFLISCVIVGAGRVFGARRNPNGPQNASGASALSICRRVRTKLSPHAHLSSLGHQV